MSSSSTKTVVGLLFGAAGILAMSAFLAKKSQPFNVQRHAEAVDHLNALVQVDQKLQRDVLLARHGMMQQYDPLVQDAAALRRELKALRSSIGDVVDPVPMAPTIDALAKVVAQRLDKVEEFKPRNAVSRNSLRYLPLAWKQYEAPHPGDESRSENTLQDATRAVRGATDAYVAPSEASRKSANEALERYRPKSDEGRLLKRHATRVVEADSVLAPLVAELMQPVVLDAAAKVRNEFKDATDAAIARSERWQVAFYAWGIGLLALLIYAGFKLVFLYRNLDQLVRTRTAALDARTQELQLIFDTLDQGFVLVESSGKLRPERSAALESWFGKLPADGSVSDIFASVDARLSDWLDFAWDDVFTGLLPPEMGLLQLPKSVAGNEGQTFSIDYRLTESPDGEPQVLVVVSDATDAVRRRESETAQRQTAAALQTIHDDRTGFVAFFKEMDKHIKVLDESADEATVKRTVHTLKGNAGFMGLEGLHKWASDAEIAMEASGDLLAKDQLDQLKRQWKMLVRNTKPFIEDSTFDNVVIPKEEFRDVIRQLKDIPQAESIATTLFSMSTLPVADAFERAGRQAQQVALRLEKYAPRIEVHDNDIRLDAESFQPFWSSLVHVIRNCVDHGLEDADERERTGKYAQGVLKFQAMRKDGSVTIDVSDDGRGIDWERVAKRAAAKGLPAKTHDDLVDALFSSGLSTAETVTDVSGRGVGLSAVKTAVQELGGSIDIKSELGRGTTFRFCLPCNEEGQGRSPTPVPPRATSAPCLPTA